MHKKNSKFERGDKCNGNPLVHHLFFYFFHENFLMNTQNDSLHFFLCRVSISRVMNAKQKNSKFEWEDKSNEIPLLLIDFYFLSRQCSYEHSERFLTIFPYAVLVVVE